MPKFVLLQKPNKEITDFWKFLKITVIGNISLKNVEDKTLNFLLVEKMGKDLLGIKIGNKMDYSSQNYGLPSLLLCFTDLYICHPNQL